MYTIYVRRGNNYAVYTQTTTAKKALSVCKGLEQRGIDCRVRYCGRRVTQEELQRIVNRPAIQSSRTENKLMENQINQVDVTKWMEESGWQTVCDEDGNLKEYTRYGNVRFSIEEANYYFQEKADYPFGPPPF